MQQNHTIVHVICSFEIGGAEQVALYLAGSQVDLGHEVHVVALTADGERPLERRFQEAGIVTHRVRKWGPTVDPTLPLRLALLLRRLRGDVVHSHNRLALVYAAPAAHLAGAPIVHTKHGADTSSDRSSRLPRHAGRLVDTFVAVSVETANQAVAEKQASIAQVRVIENGVRLDAFAPDTVRRARIRDELGIGADAVVIGTVGRLAAVKNQPLLIRAARPLLGPRVHLVLVGDGPDRAAVEAEVEKQGCGEFVHLLGQRTDVPAIFPGFDVFALSSDSEGLPLVLLEAMACELPIVATDVGGIRDVVEDGKTGYLVPRGDERALASRLAQLADDPAIRRTLGAAGRRRALTRYSVANMCERYLGLYDEVSAGA